eukprot:362209-Chlamydomonas_euryale.AAC.9
MACPWPSSLPPLCDRTLCDRPCPVRFRGAYGQRPHAHAPPDAQPLNLAAFAVCLTDPQRRRMCRAPPCLQAPRRRAAMAGNVAGCALAVRPRSPARCSGRHAAGAEWEARAAPARQPRHRPPSEA